MIMEKEVLIGKKFANSIEVGSRNWRFSDIKLYVLVALFLMEDDTSSDRALPEVDFLRSRKAPIISKSH